MPRGRQPRGGVGSSINDSPYKHFVNQLLAAGYPPEDIARILWDQYRFKTSGATIYNYKTTFFDPMKERIKRELMDIDAFETAAKRELSEVELLRRDIEELEKEAVYLEPMRDQSSIRLRSEILFKAGTLRAKLMQLNYSQEMKEREDVLVKGIVSIIVDVLLPYIPEDRIDEAKGEFQVKLEGFLTTGSLK